VEGGRAGDVRGLLAITGDSANQLQTVRGVPAYGARPVPEARTALVAVKDLGVEVETFGDRCAPLRVRVEEGLGLFYA